MAKRKHHRRHSRRSSRGSASIKALAFGALAGGAAVVGLGYANDKIAFLRSHWYAAPGALAAGAVGLMVLRKAPIISLALAAAAAVIGVQNYRADQAQQSKKTETSPNQGTAGYGEAGRVRRMAIRGDSGMHERPGNAGALQGARAGQLLFEQAGSLQGPGSRAIRTSSASGLTQ